MDITTLAAWGEFLGGLAVVVSLIYLATQIRQNSRLLRVSTAAVVSDASTSVTSLVAQDPEMARIFVEGQVDRGALSEADRRSFDPIVSMVFSARCLEYHLWQEGAVIPILWETRRRQMAWFLSNPGIQQWWSTWRGTFDDDFGDFVDGLIREGEAVG